MPRPELVELTIEKVVFGGQGLGRLGPVVVFVPFSAPGDRLKVAVETKKKSYWVGRIDEILEASPLRVTPKCPWFGACGGCDLQHLNYDAQLVARKLIVNESLQRLGRVFVPPGNPAPAEDAWHYRNRAQYPVSGPPWQVGFFARRTHDIVDVAACAVQPELLDGIRASVKARLETSHEAGFDEVRGTGNIRHIALRHGARTGEAALIFVTAREQLPPALYNELMAEHPALVSITQNVNPARTNRIMTDHDRLLQGRNYYCERVLDKTLQISAGSFFQANTRSTEQLLKLILRYLEPNGSEHVLDLFSGVGTIAIPIAGFVRQVTAIELSSSAVTDAGRNLLVNEVRNVEMLEGRVEARIADVQSADAVILDPPRKGCEPGLVGKITALKPRVVIYVSCNPTTLARDLAAFADAGYETEQVQLVDMFPQTTHIETVARLKPNDQ